MAQGLEQFEASHFSIGGGVTMIGTSTPQYMCHSGVAERIRRVLPDARLIAILRNPATRAASHYKMARRWGHERRSLAQAVGEQLEPVALRQARALDYDSMGEVDHTLAYICWGEYARILQDFAARFPREQILCVLQEDLLDYREETYRRILQFLGVDDGFVPASLVREYHRGGEQARSQLLERLLDLPAVKALGRMLLKGDHRRTLRYHLKIWNSRPGAVAIPEETYNMMMRHYEIDIEYVEKWIGGKVAWPIRVDRPVRV